jgi:hypothetical protein
MAMAPGEVGQILIVDAAGARLAIVTITDAAATAAQRGELQGVIDSVRIEAPASAVPSP